MENFEILMSYSPVVMLVLVYFIQLKIFVTPQELEKNIEKFCWMPKNALLQALALMA